MTSDELRWQTEDDARIIRQYTEIANDKARFDAATDILKKEVEFLETALQGFKNGGS